MKEFIEKLIGRLEEEIDIIKDEVYRDYEERIIKECAIENVIDIVNELAEEYINTSTDTSSGWVTCSERLPKEPMFCEDVYIIQASDVVSPYSAYWNGEYWTNELDEIIENVIAWQPLPAPYKAGD